MAAVRGPFQIAGGRQGGEIWTLWVNSLIKGEGERLSAASLTLSPSLLTLSHILSLSLSIPLLVFYHFN